MGTSRYFDRIAVALSAICIVHCLAVPIILAILPIAAVTFGPDAHFHWLMLWVVVPTSAIGLSLGYRVHRHIEYSALGVLGLVVLAAAAVWGHASWTVLAETGVSVAGSIVLATAHLGNYREVKRLHVHC